ncbi:UDP-N-acetylmuramoyl-L-alanyl-D-glutamate--2,6-diaminopimelate ligase [Paraferrimonas sedimenticola]|uniref:UDP-N-acetylmuramoyl-L-alanyl-D-glutamate--2,6-diaminopimelate ligase n=1 Tax=Paraferrimonas sedimenticola TaxID=375674 RepID=A0AA37RY79_9GAMM|nr:UDP-N-acetylmuramoyl-L-alanyl-D-glutamate--2,6-diaminopimelate ligase [Paraferrimonas sedimenticola]GLP97504.1 UDP-N-acetylmuramyl-tripeptide synthetase [Paraferrimonas sedimenticola]
MMYIRDLLAPWFHYSGPEQFAHLRLDSREIQQGDLFVAIPGHALDGRRFIAKAIEAGASAVLCHSDDAKQHGQVENLGAPVIYFSELSGQLAALARQAYPFNDKQTLLAGVTGTNGKTSVSQLMAQLVSLAGEPAAVLGTIGNGLWGSLSDSINTTSDALTTARQLHDCQNHNAKLVAMEVSSHGLVQGRVATLPFSVAVFTNLSRDHLDYHGDMQNYALAKRRLFEFRRLKHRLFNLDDSTGQSWHQEFGEQASGYSVAGHQNADYFVSQVNYHDAGVSATLHSPSGEFEINSPLLGPFNLSNLLAALGALDLLGFDLTQLTQVCTHLQPIAGRMEAYHAPGKATLVVDYAHTSDALEQALSALRPHTKGKLWCVFGCGGDRDKGKRPLMAQAAEAHADQLVLTQDNPRSESVAEIIRQMREGLTNPQAAIEVQDRRQAIAEALAQADTDDVILVAGKGHETYHEVMGKKLPYDERAYVASLLNDNDKGDQ